ncbi:hypothetical protein B4U80_13367, partial [Leptotrombidium deliense]
MNQSSIILTTLLIATLFHFVFNNCENEWRKVGDIYIGKKEIKFCEIRADYSQAVIECEKLGSNVLNIANNEIFLNIIKRVVEQKIGKTVDFRVGKIDEFKCVDYFVALDETRIRNCNDPVRYFFCEKQVEQPNIENVNEEKNFKDDEEFEMSEKCQNESDRLNKELQALFNISEGHNKKITQIHSSVSSLKNEFRKLDSTVVSLTNLTSSGHQHFNFKILSLSDYFNRNLNKIEQCLENVSTLEKKVLDTSKISNEINNLKENFKFYKEQMEKNIFKLITNRTDLSNLKIQLISFENKINDKFNQLNESLTPMEDRIMFKASDLTKDLDNNLKVLEMKFNAELERKPRHENDETLANNDLVADSDSLSSKLANMNVQLMKFDDKLNETFYTLNENLKTVENRITLKVAQLKKDSDNKIEKVDKNVQKSNETCHTELENFKHEIKNCSVTELMSCALKNSIEETEEEQSELVQVTETHINCSEEVAQFHSLLSNFSQLQNELQLMRFTVEELKQNFTKLAINSKSESEENKVSSFENLNMINRSVEIGDELELNCKSDDITNSYNWTLNGFKLEHFENMSSINISAILPNIGIYKCESSVNDEHYVKTFSVMLNSIPKVNLSENVVAKLGENVRLDCFFNGPSDMVGLFLFENNSRLVGSNKYKLERTSERTSLIIHRVTIEDFTGYKCIIHRKKFRLDTVVQLIASKPDNVKIETGFLNSLVQVNISFSTTISEYNVEYFLTNLETAKTSVTHFDEFVKFESDKTKSHVTYAKDEVDMEYNSKFRLKAKISSKAFETVVVTHNFSTPMICKETVEVKAE